MASEIEELTAAIRELSVAISVATLGKPATSADPTPGATFTIHQASERLGDAFSVKYLRSELRPGRFLDGIGFRKNGRPTGSWIFTEADLEEIIKRHRTQPPGQKGPIATKEPLPLLPSGVSPRSTRLKKIRKNQAEGRPWNEGI